ncbi:MAG TPA: polysaccharide biosynthesis/export family protein [Paracoccaceae bacterium]|nr:polysaccharide biosynthesis/export family protein [Paracoccaceae bacterium]
MTLRLLAIPVLMILAGCDGARTSFPVDPEAVNGAAQALGTEVTVVQLTADTIGQYGGAPRHVGGRTTLPPAGAWTYRVGRGDILDIVVWSHPELTMPAGEGRSPQESGQRVQADGTFFYPYVGQVPAEGLTPEAIREGLTQRLADYIADPQIEVKVVGYNAQAVSVTGEVARPSRMPLTAQPLTLLDAVDAAGGLSEEADATRVTVRRDGRLYTVDLQSFLSDGIGANNPVLLNGDVVNIPRLERKEAYLLGQIVKPSTIDLTTESQTLTQALTRVGGLRENDADARGVFVFRNTGGKAITVHQLDASNPVAFLIGTRFYLQPQDVVYVTTAPVSRWNQVISSLLPSLSAARAVRAVNE